MGHRAPSIADKARIARANRTASDLAPIITQLRSEFSGQGLQVIGPTRLYGYTAQIEHASASDELGYIDAVRHRFYAGLLDMPVPISRYNFDTYGASTTPTTASPWYSAAMLTAQAGSP